MSPARCARRRRFAWGKSLGPALAGLARRRSPLSRRRRGRRARRPGCRRRPGGGDAGARRGGGCGPVAAGALVLRLRLRRRLGPRRLVGKLSGGARLCAAAAPGPGPFWGESHRLRGGARRRRNGCPRTRRGRPSTGPLASAHLRRARARAPGAVPSRGRRGLGGAGASRARGVALGHAAQGGARPRAGRHRGGPLRRRRGATARRGSRRRRHGGGVCRPRAGRHHLSSGRRPSAWCW